MDASIKISRSEINLIFDKYSKKPIFYRLSNFKELIIPKFYTINKNDNGFELSLKKEKKSIWKNLLKKVNNINKIEKNISDINNSFSNIFNTTTEFLETEEYIKSEYGKNNNKSVDVSISGKSNFYNRSNFNEKNKDKKFLKNFPKKFINKSNNNNSISNKDNFFDKISNYIPNRNLIKSEVFEKKNFLPTTKILNKKHDLNNYKNKKLNFYKNLKKKNFQYQNKSVDLKLKLPLNKETIKIEKKLNLRNRVKNEYKKLQKKNRQKKREKSHRRNRSTKSANLKKPKNPKNPKFHSKNDFLILFKNETKEIFKELNLDKKWIEREILNLRRFPDQLKGFIEIQSRVIKILAIKFKNEETNRMDSEMKFSKFVTNFGGGLK